jgi:hypothetical protein
MTSTLEREQTSTRSERYCTACGRQAGRGGRPSPSGLADVIETILDKGLVIDAYVRVSLVGIELVTIDPRVVVDTYVVCRSHQPARRVARQARLSHFTRPVESAAAR